MVFFNHIYVAVFCDYFFKKNLLFLPNLQMNFLLLIFFNVISFSSQQILKCRDKELNAWVSVKKMSQYRSEYMYTELLWKWNLYT